MEESKNFQIGDNSLGSKIFNVCNIILIILISVICLMPFIYTLATSLSSGRAITSGEVMFWPVEFNLNSYATVFQNSTMVKSFVFTLILTVLYTVICMIMTIFAAYAMTKKDLPGRRFFMLMLIFTMYLNPGIIPNFMVVKNLGLLDTIWSLILPGMISVYNMIILRTSFESLPSALLDAAYIDGCSEFRTLVQIVLPLSMPVIATLTLFYAVGRWNGFQDALYYINDQNLYPLQLRLQEIINIDRVNQATAMEGSVQSMIVPEGVKAASIVFATLPILIPYPFLQRYFISGVMIGSVKE